MNSLASAFHTTAPGAAAGAPAAATTVFYDCCCSTCCRLKVFDLPQAVLQLCQQQQQQLGCHVKSASVDQNAADSPAGEGSLHTAPSDPRPAEAAGGAPLDGAVAAIGAEWQSGLQVHAGETVYDYCWFSGMSAADPLSCCFASSSRVRSLIGQEGAACAAGSRGT
jgi:hypothetical protein